MTGASDSVIPRAQAGPMHCFYVRKSESSYTKSVESDLEKFFHIAPAGFSMLAPIDFNVSARNYFRAAYFQHTPNPLITVDPMHLPDPTEWVKSHEFVCEPYMKSPPGTNSFH
jgi:hypothetical protein